MRCQSCHRLSWSVVCDACRDRLLVPSPTSRKIGTLEVVSLFAYEHLEPFLLTKHTPTGWRVYRYFGRHFIAPFLDEFVQKISQETAIRVVTAGSEVSHGYSHTAAMLHGLRHVRLRSDPVGLRARHAVHYAGKSLAYRLAHPRGFVYTGPPGGDAILLDDIVTTGLTLQEAARTLEQRNVNVLFGLVMADAQRV